MLKIKMHAIYDHFPEHNPLPGEKYIDAYGDRKVFDCKAPGKNIAMLFEPKALIQDAYDYVYNHPEYFSYIFTHDSKLLKYDHARYLSWADVWLTTDSEKNKGISLCTSYKNWCPLHKARLQLAGYYAHRPEVDVFYGAWGNPNIKEVPARSYLEHYKFSIIIENDLDELWFTEKILNCFATKTVPIYVGATKIHEYFNIDGIIYMLDWRDIITMLSDFDVDAEYAKRQQAIEDNFKRVEPWKVPWKERFFRKYERMLEELMNE